MVRHRAICVERAPLPAAGGEPVAAADSTAASTALDSRFRKLHYGRVRHRPRRLLLPPELFRGAERTCVRGLLLGHRGEEGTRRQSIPAGFLAAGGSLRN